MPTKIDEEQIIKDIRDLVFIDRRIVTFNYISKQYKYDICKAKEVLQKVIDELNEEKRNDFISSFYITGYAKGSNPEENIGDDDFLRYNIMEADADEVDEHKDQFFSIVDGVSLRSLRSSEITKRDKDLYAKPTTVTEDLQEVKTESTSKIDSTNCKASDFKKEEKSSPKKLTEKINKEDTNKNCKEIEKKPEKDKATIEIKKERTRTVADEDDDDEEEVIVKRKKPKESFFGDSPVKQEKPQENGTKRKPLDDENGEKPDSKKSKKEVNGNSKAIEKGEVKAVAKSKVEAKKDSLKKAPAPANKNSQQKRITDFFRK